MISNNNYIVYKHTFPNGKVYIGITSNSTRRRWREGHGYKSQKHLYNAILKYGWDNIKHEILYSNITKEEACTKEKDLIKYYKSLNISYNNSNGGETNEGYIGTELQREHARNIWKGKKLPKEVVEKIKSALSSRVCKNSTKLKRSLALQAYYARKVYKLNKLGKVLAVYNNLQDASQDNNAKRRQIAQCCKRGALLFRNYYYLYEEEYKNYGISKRLLTHDKPVIIYKDNIFIGEYNDVKEASNVLGINILSLKRACTNFKLGNKIKGYTVKYKY